MKKVILILGMLPFLVASLKAQTRAEEEAGYTNGTFIVNEDWYTHQNSTVNWISDDGVWTYRVFQKANPGQQLGATAQHGTIYGGKFYVVCKQDKDPGASVTGSRFAVCDARTMKLVKDFKYIATNDAGKSIADGRSFLPVNEHKGYIGTSNGIWIYDMDKMEIGGQIEGTGNPNGTSYGQLYLGQVGTMIRKDEYVYAVHQQNGLQIIDAETDKLVRNIQAPVENDTIRGFGSAVLSKDGNIWISVARNQQGGGGTMPYLFKYNPSTQEMTRIDVPEGLYPPANSWYAWTPDGFCSSKQNNVLYWNGGPNSWFSNFLVVKYDIDSGMFSKFIDLQESDWRMYGASFRVDPVTDETFISLFHDFGDPTYILRKYSNTGEMLAEYPMITQYWFPSIPVFPDNEAPVAHDITKQWSYEPFVISLAHIATDADNMEAGMVKTIAGISNEEVLSAKILNGDLHVTPKGVNGESDVTLTINSNGQIVQTVVAVSIDGNFDNIEQTQFVSNAYYYGQSLYINNCEGYQFSLYDASGANVEQFVADRKDFSLDVELSKGIYILKGTKDTKNTTLKISVK